MSSVRPPQTAPDGPPGPGATEPELDRRTEGRDLPPWRPWTVPAVLALGIGIWVLATVVVDIAAQAGGTSVSHPTPAVSLILDGVFDLSFVAAALYFTVVHGGARAADFGYRRVSLGLAAGAVVTAAVAYYVITFLYAAIFSLHGSDKLPSELGANKSTAALVGAGVFVCVVAPMAEELFFRGFIFGALRRIPITLAGRDLGSWVAAIITGILFGLVHAGSASPQYLVPLGLLGFMLCLVRWRTGSLYPCMALHSANNALALGVNQLHWNGGEILGLVVVAWAVIAVLTGPFAAGPLPAVPAGATE
jgi:membrane protease YdiL (CAAX protease family)